MIKTITAAVIAGLLTTTAHAEEKKIELSEKFVTSSEKAIKDYKAYFDSLDLDRSGRITRDELAAASERKHAKFDVNADGYVAADEYAAREKSLTLSSALARIAQIDEDDDNRISKEEARRTALQVMRFDLDRSGDLVFSEIMVTAPPVVRRYFDQHYSKAR